MNVNFYRNIIFIVTCLVIISSLGCAPEENDLVPPNAAIDSGVVDSPTASTTATITGTMDSGSTVEVEVISAAIVSNLIQGGTTWSFVVTGMVEGENLILVSVADEVGNTRTIQLSILVDLTGPIVTIDQYPVTAQAGIFTFAGTVSEADSTVIFDVLDAGGAPTAIPTQTATVDADIWTVSNLDLSSLNGVYTVTATGTDRLIPGNVSASPAIQTMTFAAGNPSFVISVPAFPIVLDTDVDLQIINGTTDIDNSLTASPYAIVTPPDFAGDWSATLSSLPAGKTIVTFDASDELTSTVQNVLVVRDQTAPFVVEWSSPAVNEIEILFNETMDSLTVDVTSLLLVDSTGTAVLVTAVATDLTNKIITFTTATNLTVAETYTATLQTTDVFLVEDGRGNSLAASYVWTFKKQ